MCENKLESSVSCEDIKEVISLPTEIGECGYSDTLDNYIRMKCQQHDSIIERMRTEVDKFNLALENEVNQLEKVISDELEFINNEFDKFNLSDIKSVEQWIFVCDLSKKHKLRIESSIEELTKDVKVLQGIRVENIKSVLSEYRQEANKLGFLNIENVEEIFHKEIMNININTLKNTQTIEDLKFRFQVAGQEIINKRQEDLNHLVQNIAETRSQYLWDKVKERQSEKIIVDTLFESFQNNLKVKDDMLDVIDNLVTRLSEFTTRIQYFEAHEIDEEFVEVSVRRRSTTTYNLLYTLCENMEDLLRTALKSLLEGFNSEIDRLTRTLMLTYQQSRRKTSMMQKFAIDFETLTTNQNRDLEFMKSFLQEIVATMSKETEQALSFVSDVKSIWTNHVSRIEKVKTDLKSTLDSSNAIFLKEDKDKNIKINSQIKALREAKDADMLETLCGSIYKLFNELTDKWSENYRDKLKIVSETHSKEVGELFREKLSEINEFLRVKYPKQKSFARTFPENLSRFWNDDTDTQIDTCNKYVDAVKNRALGMYEILERCLPLCEIAVKEDLENDLNVCVEILEEKYKTHMAELKVTNIKNLKEVKQNRLRELNNHIENWRSHDSDVNAILAELGQQYDEVKSNKSLLVSTFYEKLANLTKDISFDSSSEIKDIIFKLEQEWNLLVESLENCVLAAKSCCENKFDMVKGSNDMFLSSAKDFKHGGNYNSEELKVLRKDLKQLEKKFTSRKNMLIPSYNSLLTDISRQPLDATIELLKDKLNKTILEGKIVDMIAVIRISLRREVIQLKTLEEAIGIKITQLEYGSVKSVKLVNEIITMANSIFEYMKCPAEVLSLECAPNRQHSAPSIDTNIKSKKLSKKSTFESNLLLNHTKNSISKDDNIFLARTKGLLIEKYSALLQYIQETFNIKTGVTGSQNKGKKKKKDSAQSFGNDKVSENIEKLKTTLQLFNVECEMAWLHRAKNFRNKIICLRNITNALTENVFLNIQDEYMKSLNILETEYKQNIVEMVTEGTQKRDQMRQRLVLPLAHPTYQHKLSQLHKQATVLCQFQDQACTNIVTLFKDSLQSKHDEYVEQIKLLMESLNNIQKLVFEGDSYTALFDCLDDFIHIKTEASDGEISIKNEDSIYPMSIWSDEDDSEDSCQKSVSTHLSSSSITSKSKIIKLEDITKINIDKMATENLKMSVEQIQKLYGEAMSFQKSFEDILTAWIRSLDFDIEQAKQVYVLRPR